MSEDTKDCRVRLRQAVLAASQLEPVAERLREQLGLGEPFADPGVEYFGLRNAVFALGDTFLEVVSPLRPKTSAGRLLDRRGGDCGYMLMFQLDDLAGARERARGEGVDEVFEVDLEDIAEVHLHPGQMRGAIVSLSQPQPPGSWRWGGPGWEQRSAAARVAGATISVRDPDAVQARWSTVLGARPADAGLTFTRDDAEPGVVEIAVAAPRAGGGEPFEVGGVRFVFVDNEEDR
jgi:glyoxalase-like protein